MSVFKTCSKIRFNDLNVTVTGTCNVGAASDGKFQDDQRIVDHAGNKKSTITRRKVFERKWSFAVRAAAETSASSGENRDQKTSAPSARESDEPLTRRGEFHQSWSRAQHALADFLGREHSGIPASERRGNGARGWFFRSA